MVHMIAARVVPDYVVWLRYSEGGEGRVDPGQGLHGRVFEPLRDPQEFGELSLDPELGTVTCQTAPTLPQNSSTLRPDVLLPKSGLQ